MNMSIKQTQTGEKPQPSILIVDDDELFLQVLSRAMRKRGFDTFAGTGTDQGMVLAQKYKPQFAIIDLRLGCDSGLTLVKQLIEFDPDVRILVLTGYASVATAVEAIKLGAIHYLAKPANTQQIVDALHLDEGNSHIEIADNPMSVDRLEWEHIQKILTDCGGNISAAARNLGMHRRTLQRKLAKKPVKR